MAVLAAILLLLPLPPPLVIILYLQLHHHLAQCDTFRHNRRHRVVRRRHLLVTDIVLLP